MINNITAAGQRSALQANAVCSVPKAAAGHSFSDVLNGTVSKTVNLDDIFDSAASKYGIDVNLLKAVAKAESGFKADAVSSCGAQGIMQLMPSTAASLGVSDAFDPAQNIDGGAKYLSSLLNKYGSAKLVLAAYNAGSGNVEKYGGVPPFKETQDYVRRVLSYANQNISAGSTVMPYDSSIAGSLQSVSSTGSANNAETVSAAGSANDFTQDDYKLFLSIFAQEIKQNAISSAVVNSQTGKSSVFNGFYTNII